ncbi:MAG: hydroxymethylglutaryl-CoA synthase [Candidatus Thermoplasmatota archaeon]|nr:hydroxymethylglutaryl-CoA synthase [Candidatus Thermoplasmatota archaeon]MBS3790377.1 hydroxymethylglutaryl-CoA synthase [Candidatus Thermoplasmatota archaeon]
MKAKNEVGIKGYAGYVPKYRVTPEEIGDVWGKDGKTMGKGLRVESKSVPSPDEDVVTISTQAAKWAMRRADIKGEDLEAIYVGSESHPYAVKPTATIVAASLAASPHMTAADYEFACKAGTAAFQTCMGLVSSGMIENGMAIGADTSQGAPGDALEYTAAAGGAAYVIGSDDLLAKIEETISYTTDTPDFWRREGEKYPQHGGRFTGKPAYFKHIMNCTEKMLERTGKEPEDYDYAVFHQPNGKFPVKAAKKLGFSKEQLEPGLLVTHIGNTYSGAVPLGLAATLDQAEPGDNILVTSYGSGAGSDSFDIMVTDNIEKMKDSEVPTVEEVISNKEFISYSVYAKFRKKIEGGR